MNTLSAFCVPALLGFLTLAALLQDVPVRHKGLFLLSASLPTGFGICSLALFASLLLNPLHAKALSIAISLVLIFFLLFRLNPFYSKGLKPVARALLPEGNPHSLNPASLFKGILAFAGFILFLYTVFTIVQFYFLSVSTNVLGGWDARYFWALKAKFMFRSPPDWQLMFSHKLPWSNQDYPLLWPGTLAWGWHWLGQETPIWGPFASIAFYVPCSLLLVWYLAEHHSLTVGWLAGSFALVLLPPLFWAVHQYADVPLTFFITACGLMLVTALHMKSPRLFMVSGLMGGLAAWTKNEGILFIIWIYLLLGTILIRHHGKNLSASLKTLKMFALGTCVPLLAVAILKYLSRNAGSPTQSLQHPLGFLSSGVDRSLMILKAFYVHASPWGAWKGLWEFFVLAAFFTGLKRQKKGYEELLFIIVLLVNAGYFAILLITSPDLPWQIRTALDRLIIHSSILAAAFVFEILTFNRSIPLK